VDRLPLPLGFGDPGIYAIRATDASQAPYLDQGQTALVSPAAECNEGDVVVLWPANGDPAIVSRMAMTPTAPGGDPDPGARILIVEGHHPSGWLAMAAKDVMAIHRVVCTYAVPEPWAGLSGGAA
jgi:hypothetical protein